jgi:hypothetical protein
MSPVNNRTYQLLKENKVIMETQCSSFDRAIDEFFESHPEAYGDKSYTFKRVKFSYE